MKKKRIFFVIAIIIIFLLLLFFFVCYQKKYGEINRLFYKERDYLHIYKGGMQSFSNEELEQFEKEYHITFSNGKILRLNNEKINYFNFMNLKNQTESVYYAPLAFEYLQFSIEKPTEKIIGRLAQTKNEIVISNYYADVIMHALKIEISYEEFLDSYADFIFANQTYKIVGIVDYQIENKEMLTKYKVLESTDIINQFLKYRQRFLSFVYVTDDFFETFKEYKNTLADLGQFRIKSEDRNTEGMIEVGTTLTYYDGLNFVTRTLEENEAVVDLSLYTDKEQLLREYETLKPYDKDKFIIEKSKSFEIIGKNITIIPSTLNKQEEVMNLKIIGVTFVDDYQRPLVYTSDEVLNRWISPTVQNGTAYFTVKNKKDLYRFICEMKEKGYY